MRCFTKYFNLTRTVYFDWPKGELIGEIRATPKFLKRPVASIEELAPKGLKELKTLLQQLEVDLN
jgi:hypothetical protein